MTTTTQNRQIQIAPETITKLDSVAQDYQLSTADATPFKKAFLLAEAIGHMRQLLTPEVMKPIMALMNTDLGFRTDRDPHVKNKQGEYNKPYTEDVVRDVLIESTLRGFFPVNNEFNIITGRFYAAKNGVRRKVTQWPGLTDLKDSRSVPRMSEKGAVVVCNASWKLKGKADEMNGIEIAVKVNDFMGSDAVLGKAERKQMKLILDRISGEVTPDGDVDDVVLGSPGADTPPKTTKVETVPKGAKQVTGTEKTSPPANGTPQTDPVTQPTERTNATAGNAETVPPDPGLSDQEKAEIERADAVAAAREMVKTDPETALGMLMDIDKVTVAELEKTLRDFKVQLPADFKGPGSLSPKRITQLMEPKAWNTFMKYITEKLRVEAAAATGEQPAP